MNTPSLDAAAKKCLDWCCEGDMGAPMKLEVGLMLNERSALRAILEEQAETIRQLRSINHKLNKANLKLQETIAKHVTIFTQ